MTKLPRMIDICNECYVRLGRPKQVGFTGGWGFHPCAICKKNHAEFLCEAPDDNAPQETT